MSAVPHNVLIVAAWAALIGSFVIAVLALADLMKGPTR